MSATILNEKNIDMDYVTRQGIKVANSTSGTSNEVTNNFAGDVNQTQKRLQDVTMENFMNGLAVWEEKFGNWTDIIVNAIKHIKKCAFICSSNHTNIGLPSKSLLIILNESSILDSP